MAPTNGQFCCPDSANCAPQMSLNSTAFSHYTHFTLGVGQQWQRSTWSNKNKHGIIRRIVWIIFSRIKVELYWISWITFSSFIFFTQISLCDSLHCLFGNKVASSALGHFHVHQHKDGVVATSYKTKKHQGVCYPTYKHNIYLKSSSSAILNWRIVVKWHPTTIL